MKNKFSILPASFLLLALLSCNKKETIDYYEGGTPPVLTASTTTVTLESGQESNTALVLNWTNPDYKFTTGISSQDVNYTLEMDTLGANFSSSKKVSTVLSKDLTKSYTVSELNSILGNDMLLQLDPRRNYTMELRVTSKIGSAVPLTSNVVSFTTKPFQPPPKVTPPASGELYITGSALASGWTNSPPASQKFTKVSSTFFTITVPLTGDQSYTFLPTWGSWNDKYSIAIKNDPNKIYGGDFQWQGEDILAPPISANYKIDVDFQLGKFTVVKQ